jgi:hypothetical protein
VATRKWQQHLEQVTSMADAQPSGQHQQQGQQQKPTGQQQVVDVLFDTVTCPHPEDGVPCWHVSDLDIEHLLSS